MPQGRATSRLTYGGAGTSAATRRKILRGAGFAVDRQGPLTSRLVRAWNHYQKHGAKGSTAWNLGNPRQDQASVPFTEAPDDRRGTHFEPKHPVGKMPASPTPKKKQPHPSVAPPAPMVGGGGGGGGAAEDPTMFPGVPPVRAGNTNTSRLLGRGMADTLAGYQFDPQIHELLTQIAQGTRDTAQHQRDIGGWYDQVQGAQRTAGQRDIEAGERSRGDVSKALQSIVTSLGGSRGAGVVGAAGLEDLTSLAAQGASQDRYNADLAPLLQQEEAGAHSREAALASQTRSQRDQALVGLRGQRGQARAKALMDIIQANNQSRQGNFQNRLAVQNAALAAASLGLNADQTYAGIAAQKATTKMNQRKLKLESLAAQQKSGKMSWANLNYPDRQTVLHDAVARATGELVPKHWDPVHVYNSALQYLRSGGFRSAKQPGAKGKYSRQSQRQILQGLKGAIEAQRRAWAAKYPKGESGSAPGTSIP